MASTTAIPGSTSNELERRHKAAVLPEQEQAISQPRWYATYTFANHEKRVAAELGTRDVEHFLPLYNSVRRWKDRRVQIDLPLFPGYVFVRLALRDRLRVLQVSSVVRFVGFNGPPTALPDEEMEILRLGLSQSLRAWPHPFLTAGRRVHIRRGPLEGLEGILLRRKGKSRFVLSVELIQRSIGVDVDAADVELVANSGSNTRR